MQHCEPYNIVTTKPSNSDGVYDECHVPEQEPSHYDSIWTAVYKQYHSIHRYMYTCTYIHTYTCVHKGMF